MSSLSSCCGLRIPFVKRFQREQFSPKIFMTLLTNHRLLTHMAVILTSGSLTFSALRKSSNKRSMFQILHFLIPGHWSTVCYIGANTACHTLLKKFFVNLSLNISDPLTSRFGAESPPSHLNEEHFRFPRQRGTTASCQGDSQIGDSDHVAVNAVDRSERAVREDAADEGVVGRMIRVPGHVGHGPEHVSGAHVLMDSHPKLQAVKQRR